MDVQEFEVRDGSLTSFATDADRQAAIVGLQRKIDLLAQDLAGIDAQLGDLNRTVDGQRMDVATWNEWRNRAKHARRKKVEAMNELKDDLRRVSVAQAGRPWVPLDLGLALEKLTNEGLRARLDGNYALIALLKGALKQAKAERSAMRFEAERRGLHAPE